MRQTICGVVAALLFSIPAVSKGQLSVDPKLPDYQPVPGVSGSVTSIGSDTTNNLMTLWSEGFLKYYPSIRISIEGKGSSTAPPALASGKANFGPMSRLMKDSEIDEFEKKFGYKPTPLGTSVDCLAVFVNKDNPLKGLSLTQTDAIFSSTRKRGGTDVSRWSQVGLTGDFANAPISLYGRNSASGTYGFFKEQALLNGDFKPSVKEQPGSSSVVQGVASNKFAIGYSGIGYITADVRAVPLGEEEGRFFDASPQNAYSGEYPLARFLYVYVNYRPGSQLDPLRREFVKFVFSKQGQEIVIKDGYFPVSAVVAQQQLAKLGIEIKLASN